MTQDRTEAGQFASKSETPRHVRSIRLTDETWQKIGYAADKRRITRADLIEQMSADGLFEDGVRGNNLNQEHFLADVEAIAQQILSDPTVTRNGKDKGAVKRGLEALLKSLSSV